VPWREVALFVLFAYALAWIWWAPIVSPKFSGLSLTRPLPDLTRDPTVGRVAFGMFGPGLAAFILRLARRAINRSPGPLGSWRHYALATIVPAMFVAAVVLFDNAFNLGHFVWSGLPLALAVPIVVVVNGLITAPVAFGEEYGWRGYLLPRLLPLGASNASLIVGVIWAAWHLPVLLIGLNYGGAPFWIALPVFVVEVVASSFVFTWFFLASGGSVLVVTILHAVLDATGDTFTGPQHIPDGDQIVTGAGGIVATVLLLVPVIGFGALRRLGFTQRKASAL
jgi:membrane protease YdiL (CAAX protease family)